MPSPTNLYEYYSSQGQALPSVQARQTIASQAGIQNYTGSGDQNATLLRYLTSNGTSAQNANPVIQSGNIGTQPLNVPTPNPIPNVANELSSAYANFTNQANTAQTNVDTLSNERNQMKNDYQVLLDQLTNQTADQQAQEQAQGLPQLSKDYQDLINTSRTQTAKYLQGLQNIETRPGIRTEVNAQSQFLNRQNAIDSMFTNSLISAKQGDITNAQAQVDRAISLKYDPIKQQIQNKMQFLELNYQDLSRADQKLADAKSKQWELQLKQIEQQKSDETAVQNAIGQLASNGMPANAVALLSKSAKNLGDILSNPEALKYMSDPLDRQIKQAQLAKLREEASGAGGIIGAAKSKNYTVISGDDIPAIARANGTTVQDILSLNPQINSTTQAIKPGQLIKLPGSNDATTQALAVILGSGKFTKDQVKLVTNAIASGQDPFTVIKNQAKNIMGQTEATQLSKYETASKTLDDIGTLLSQYYANGGKTNIISGKLSDVANKLGTVTDPKLASIATQIKSNLQVYRNAISGTAYSEQEGKDINSIFPGINKSQTLNDAILNGRASTFDSTIDAMYSTTLGDAYGLLKQQNTPKAQTVSSSTKILDDMFGGMNSTLDSIWNQTSW